jgi:hypothetical protein
MEFNRYGNPYDEKRYVKTVKGAVAIFYTIHHRFEVLLFFNSFRMKNAAFPIAICFIAFFAACVINQKPLDDSRRDAMVDSIVGTKTGELSSQAAEDLDRRRAIEVKAKADSLVQVYRDSFMNKSADNTIPNNIPMP